MKVALVTGASSGIGESTALELHKAGYTVYAAARRVQRMQGLAAQGIQVLEMDVTNDESMVEGVKKVIAETGRIDVLVNNAARLHLGTLERTSPDVLRALLEVNTVGPYLGMRAVLPQMRQQGGGSIVNVGSIDSLLGMNGVSAYAASKWALRGMTKSVAMELGRDGIRVNSVCPAGGNPAMYGPWMQQLLPILDQTRAYRENRGIPGEAPLDQIARAVVFFASDASLNCTGVDLPVDGGAHAGRFIPGFSTF
jgi:NAD(P)-dependent dehydrogenase (short-subunit alcohol dehydrogenase family)